MSHWYKQDGTPYYTLIGANGKERDVTIRDAKKVNACPSVTTIIAQLDKKFLVYWKMKQLLDVVIQYNSISKIINLGEKWQDVLISKSEQENTKYARVGNEIHDQFEKYYKEGIIDSKYMNYIHPAIEKIENKYKDWDIKEYIAEKSFCHKKGFGGKIDLILKTKKGNIILDFKTKQGYVLNSKKLYYDYCMQLAAYRKSQRNVIECGNVLVSATHENVAEIHIWPEQELKKAEKMFDLLLEYWKIANNYEMNT